MKSNYSDNSEIPALLKIPEETSRSIDAIGSMFEHYIDNKKMSSYGGKAIIRASKFLSDIEPDSLKAIIKEFPILLDYMRVGDELTVSCFNQSDAVSGKVGDRKASYDLCFSNKATKAYREELKQRIGIISPHIETAFNTVEVDEKFGELTAQVFNGEEALIKQIKPLNEHLLNLYQKAAITYVLVDSFEDMGLLDLHKLSSERDLAKRLKKAGFEVMNPTLEGILLSDFGYKAASILPVGTGIDAMVAGFINQNKIAFLTGATVGALWAGASIPYLKDNYRIIQKDEELLHSLVQNE